MQLEHSSINYNHQQSPPMYIYTSHIDHNIQQFAQIHQVTYSITTQFINQSIPNVTSMYSSNTLIINNHHSHATIKTHAKMICAYTRHIYACGTKSPQGRHLMMQQKHHSQRL
jgi:hypothetical protein